MQPPQRGFRGLHGFSVPRRFVRNPARTTSARFTLLGLIIHCARTLWGFPPRKSSFYPHGESHSSPQKRARWPPVTANGVPAELGERAPAERTWSASGRSKVPVRRAPCSVHMAPPPICIHTQRTVARARKQNVRWCLNRGGTVASNVGIAHTECCRTDKSVPRAFPD